MEIEIMTLTEEEKHVILARRENQRLKDNAAVALSYINSAIEILKKENKRIEWFNGYSPRIKDHTYKVDEFYVTDEGNIGIHVTK